MRDNMDPIDTELGKILKDWANRLPLPDDGRVKLLESAQSVSKYPDKPAGVPFHILDKATMSWVMMYSMRAGTSSLRLVS
jgi:hypothetical protein